MYIDENGILKRGRKVGGAWQPWVRMLFLFFFKSGTHFVSRIIIFSRTTLLLTSRIAYLRICSIELINYPNMADDQQFQMIKKITRLRPQDQLEK